MPAKNRIRRDNRGNLREDPATKTRAEDRQAPPFVVGQLHALTAQLCFQDAVLFAQVLDHLVLFAVEPAEERGDEQVRRNHGPSLRHAATFSDTTGYLTRDGLEADMRLNQRNYVSSDHQE